MHQLEQTFAALADPTRLAIINRLARGEATVNELAAPLPISQPAVSRHIKVLLEAGLIERRVEGTARPCRLVKENLQPIDAWLQKLSQTLEKNYARLDALLASQDK